MFLKVHLTPVLVPPLSLCRAVRKMRGKESRLWLILSRCSVFLKAQLTPVLVAPLSLGGAVTVTTSREQNGGKVNYSLIQIDVKKYPGNPR